METTSNIIGSYAPDFELPGIDGQVHHLSRYLDKFRAVCVIFMSNHCPYVNLYLDKIKQIQTQFQNLGFTIIGINANDAFQYPEDSFENMKNFAAQAGLNFPYLWDTTQDVAHGFNAKKTPEVFLLDKTGIIRYSGGIDDCAENPEASQVQYLRDAIAMVLQGEELTITSTETIGCSIKWRN